MRVNFSAPLVDIESRVQTPFGPADAGAQALRQNWVPAGACHRAGQRPDPLAGTNGDASMRSSHALRRSLRLDAGVLDDLRPLYDLGRDEFFELFGRAGEWRNRQRVEPILHVLPFEI